MRKKVPKKPKAKKLTERDKHFARLYVIDFDVEKAAMKAGYKKSVAISRAYQWISDNQEKQKPLLKAEIERLIALKAKKADITMERVLLEYKRLATFDIRKAYDEFGKLKDIHDLDDDTAAAIAGIESLDEYEGSGESREKIGTVRKIKLADKRGALQDLMRHMGGFEKDNEQSNPNSKPQIVATISELTDEEKMKTLQDLMR